MAIGDWERELVTSHGDHLFVAVDFFGRLELRCGGPVDLEAGDARSLGALLMSAATYASHLEAAHARQAALRDAANLAPGEVRCSECEGVHYVDGDCLLLEAGE